jgi:plasmid maintenance system antidote protein VapI
LGDNPECLGNQNRLKRKYVQILFATLQLVNEIVRGKRGIMPDAAWLFAEAFGTIPEFWLNRKTNYDLVRFRLKQQVTRIDVAV